MTTTTMTITSPPQSHFGRASRHPHVREYTLPLCVLAVTYTMRNEALRSAAWHYGTLRIVTECYRALTERYGTIKENIDYAHPKWILNFAHHYNVGMRPSLTENINPKVIKTM